MASTRGRPLFNCFRAQVHACTRCLQSKVAPFQQPFMEANVKGGHGPLAGSDGPGCDAAAWHVSGQPDSKPVSCNSYIYCHCHDSGTLMSLNVSGTKLHFKSPTAERRHVLCFGVGGDRTHASRPGGAGYARLSPT